jgi:phosphocarrier protein HPr
MTEELQPAEDNSAQVSATGSALLFHEAGLHARPAIKLIKLAKRFQSEVRVGVSSQGPWTNAKSIASVMAMKTPSQSTLYFEARGDDAHDAVSALIKLVDSDFTSVADDGE